MDHPNNVDSPYSDYFTPRRDYTDRTSSVPSRARDAMSSVYSMGARLKLRRLLEAPPDIAHMHLIYHQLTLSIVDELAGQGIPSVLTITTTRSAVLLMFSTGMAHRAISVPLGRWRTYSCTAA